jgi:serine/threonine-protein kinase
MFTVGSLVAGYRIEQVLATGATGTVYLATNLVLARREALKVLRDELSRDSQFRERFLREADIASGLDHPNIVSVYERGEAENGQLWIAMQYVAGTDAEAALGVGMSAARAVRIVGEVAKALDYVHQRKVVHHDVKPGNVLLSNDGQGGERVLLSDFGVARATGGPDNASDVSTLAATLAYAAPEVITGGHIDGRADVYSLGCTLFRLLTGRPPFFAAEGTTAIAIAHLHQTPPRLSDYLPGTTAELDAVMSKVLAKRPTERFESAREFARAAAKALRLAPAAEPDVCEATGVLSGATARPIADRTVSERLPAGPTGAATRLAPAQHVDRTLRITVTPNPPRRPLPSRKLPKIVVIGAAVAAVITLTSLGLWLLRSTPSAAVAAHPSQAATATTTSDSSGVALTRLQSMLPVGDPPDACKPARGPQGATAAVACGPTTDPEGPTSATYTLAHDISTLHAAFNDTVSRATVVICPPNIQSPGPWQRIDSPTIPRGTLMCGLRAGRPLVAWTNDGQLLLNVVEDDRAGSGLEGLYTWWSSHS